MVPSKDETASETSPVMRPAIAAMISGIANIMTSEAQVYFIPSTLKWILLIRSRDVVQYLFSFAKDQLDNSEVRHYITTELPKLNQKSKLSKN